MPGHKCLSEIVLGMALPALAAPFLGADVTTGIIYTVATPVAMDLADCLMYKFGIQRRAGVLGMAIEAAAVYGALEIITQFTNVDTQFNKGQIGNLPGGDVLKGVLLASAGVIGRNLGKSMKM